MALKKNLLASSCGQIWTSLMGFVFIPLYIKILGIEAYGLIGVFMFLQVWLELFDAGMAPATNKEMSRYRARVKSLKSTLYFLRTMEITMLSIGALIAIAIYSSSNWIINNWVNINSLDETEATKALSLMGLVIALRFLENIYKSALIGLEKHVFLNFAVVILSTLRGGGAILAIMMWPSIVTFAIWQGITSLAGIILFSYLLYHRSLPKIKSNAKFSYIELAGMAKFSIGIFATTCLSLFLTQLDKIILSKTLSLQNFGYYTLAFSLAGIIRAAIGPINQTFLPRLNSLVAQKNSYQVSSVFHKGAQLLSVFVGSFSFTLVFFSDQILFIWTKEMQTVINTSFILSILALGNLIQGLLLVPYHIQLAYGWVGFTLRMNAIALFLVIPSSIYFIPQYGAISAAFIWLFLNLGILLLGIPFMFKKLLSGEMYTWYIKDLIIPLLAIFLVLMAMKEIMPDYLTGISLICYIVISFIAAVFIGTLLTPEIKKASTDFIRTLLS